MAKKAGKVKNGNATHLPQASATKRKALVRDLNKVLGSHGVKGKMAEFRLVTMAGAATRVVCRKQPNGTIVCSEE